LESERRAYVPISLIPGLADQHDETRHGEYRTQRGILDIYDRMAVTIRTGASAEIRLDRSKMDARRELLVE